jgi:hypothetical protein
MGACILRVSRDIPCEGRAKPGQGRKRSNGGLFVRRAVAAPGRARQSPAVMRQNLPTACGLKRAPDLS